MPRSTYDLVIISLDSTLSDQLTFNNIVVQLLNKEMRQSSADPITPIIATSDQPPDKIAMYAASQCGPHLDMTCHFCGKKGHFKSQCRE